METTFLLWSASATSQERRPDVIGAGGVYLSHPAGTQLLPAAAGADMEPSSREQLPPQPAAAPRVTKKKKQVAAPKRPPQRGLGVEKLERLRLQERWKKMTEIEQPTADQQIQTSPGFHGHQHQHQHQQQLLHYAMGGQCQAPQSPFGLYNGIPVYDPQQQAGVSKLSLARFAAAPAPVGYGGAWGESCFLQRHRLLGATGGFPGSSGAISAVRSTALQDHGVVDRFRIAAADTSFQVGRKLSELPSSQSLQCSEECDICIRKRMLEEKLRRTGGSGEGKQPLYLFGAVDRKADSSAEELVGTKAGRIEMKEYEFFPSSSSATTTCDGGCSSSGAAAFGSGDTLGDVPSTSSAPSRSSKQLDLTLKLSC